MRLSATAAFAALVASFAVFAQDAEQAAPPAGRDQPAAAEQAKKDVDVCAIHLQVARLYLAGLQGDGRRSEATDSVVDGPPRFLRPTNVRRRAPSRELSCRRANCPRRYAYHWGRIDGFRSSNGFYRQEDISAIALSNLETMDTFGISARLGSLAVATQPAET